MEENKTAGGSLVLVATPIGNERDLSPRALAALCEADVIYCEDTRVTGLLLQYHDLDKPMRSHHAHNERERAMEALGRVRRGQRVAVVSDAGMPAISDPGERIVVSAVAEGIPVTVIPGPNAALAALSVSGLSTGRFCFEGFLPVKGKERQARLSAVAAEPRTTILYEAPHRLVTTLLDLEQYELGERKLSLARELTKRYEEVLYGTVSMHLERYRREKPRGEFVLVLEGHDEFIGRRPPEQIDDVIDEEIIAAFEQGAAKKEIRRRLMTVYNLSRNDAYARIEQVTQSHMNSE